MARINFENRWWTSPHRKKLISLAGSEEMADGIAAGWWRVAQEYWGNGRHPVPVDVFGLLEAGPKLIEAKLAKVEADGVYATGSAEAFDWLCEKRASAKKGGQKSAAARREKYGSAQPKTPKQTRSEPEAKPNTLEPSGSGSDSGSGSGSSSGSGNLNFPSENHETAAAGAGSPVKHFIASYCERFKARWGMNPEIQPKDAGIAKRIVKGLTKEKAELYLDAYFAMPDAWLVKVKHPLFAFESKMNELVVYANSGRFTTQRQMRQADDVATSANLLQQVREGTV
jgi:hypothetical protein